MMSFVVAAGVGVVVGVVAGTATRLQVAKIRARRDARDLARFEKSLVATFPRYAQPPERRPRPPLCHLFMRQDGSVLIHRDHVNADAYARMLNARGIHATVVDRARWPV